MGSDLGRDVIRMRRLESAATEGTKLASEDPPFAPLGKGGWRNQVWVLAVCFIEKKCLMKTIYYRSADSARKGALWVVVMRQ